MKYVLTFILLIGFTFPSEAQKKRKKQKSQSVENIEWKADDFHGMKWRNIGPFRGGRSTAVTGVAQNADTYYFGSTGGGVWKTDNGGHSWNNISDGYFKTGSVGAIAVAPSDPNVIYVGMGEAPIRGVMTSHGDGVYKSSDAGNTWQHIGLDLTRQISDIRVHPQNPDLVYVSAQGSPYMPTSERGVFRSEDGGENWEKVLFVDNNSGACDLSIDMKNPRVLYAAFWDHQRLPHQMRSGGEGSGIWKTTDGGDHWKELKEGLPKTIMGKIGVVVSPANNNRVYAIIEAEKGGLYRSDDAGKSWKLINDDRLLRARSWYYMHIFADPINEDKVFVLNAPALASTDGGRTFMNLQTPHGDNHDLWVNPNDPAIMINGNDGGANISYNNGKSWSTQQNQPTAQFYRVNADNQFPYHVYGGQQDNSSLATPNTWTGSGIPYNTFYSVGGCESAYSAFNPDDPRYVYSGCYQGIISEYDTKLKTGKDIMAYPDLGLGQKSGDLKYRYNWNAPILLSSHDNKTLYHAAQNLLKSTNKGITWEEISPELTKNVPDELGWGGGPITNEAAGGENYHTILYVAESPHNAQTLWVGTDDGLVHVTNDGGQNWKNVTPPNLPEGMVNAIEISPHQPDKIILAFTRYKFNDFKPYVYITHDGGLTWKLQQNGIGETAHLRVVREDTEREGLLYAGTETGLYISFNDGAKWDSFQLNLPIVPISDLKVHHGDLIAATTGRAFWILDDLTPIRAMNTKKDSIQLYQPKDASLWGGRRVDKQTGMGTNRDGGLLSYYSILADDDDSLKITIQIVDSNKELVRTFSTDSKEKLNLLKVKPGVNKFVWDLKREKFDAPKGIMTLGGTTGSRVTPGKYELRLLGPTDTIVQSFMVMDDPRLEISLDAYQEKEENLAKIRNVSENLFEIVKDMRFIREQVEAFQKRDVAKNDSLILKKGKAIITNIDSLEKQLIQPKQKTFQDVINFPNQLDAQLIHIRNIIDGASPPITQGQKNRVGDLIEKWELLNSFYHSQVLKNLTEYNEIIDKSTIPFISSELPGKKKKDKT